MPACADSEETGCENGKPLCMERAADACRICRCTEYTQLASDAPGDLGRLAGVSGTGFFGHP